MVRADVVVAKLAELSERIQRIRSRCPPTEEALEADQDALELVSFNLMLAVQACADIAAHIAADEGWTPSANLAQAFRALQQHAVISEASARSLGRAVGLRNIVAHGYSGVQVEAVFAAATVGTHDLTTFRTEILAWLNQHGATTKVRT